MCSLSKVLSPGLRIGYTIADPATADALAALAENTYLSPNPLAQAVAARCIADGLVEANVERVRQLLKPRHDAAVAVATKAFGEALVTAPNGGYFLAAHLRADVDEATLLARTRERGVVLTPGAAFYPPGWLSPGTLFLRLPFQALDPRDFALGVERVISAVGVSPSTGPSTETRQLVLGA